ncbi:hypothetical protein E6W39_31340 [Kitasatospora acidiphila]|uniref:Uncharacterized protein n=1 Tax=Kitasatospora acidiphila TaxID=2567942 RepID=A0A540WF92_9ACTN|nr:hypothetical protein E6W39_31340 [Kitasatospora acidiphila]
MIAGGPCGTSGDDKCGNGDCPTIFTTNKPGTLAVQGYTTGHTTPGGEAIVTIPENVLWEAARALGR